MSQHGFRSVFMVASCAGAALGCYLVSLHVASERAALRATENRIAMVQRDIRLLHTEIGTRGRLAQLERWNVRVLALSAPSADQFVDGGFALARLIRPEPKPAIEAPVVLAAAPADSPRPQVATGADPAPADARPSASADQLMQVASYRRPGRAESGDAGAKAKNVGDKTASASRLPVTSRARESKVDPLAPLPAATRKSTRQEAAAAQ